MPGAKSLAEQKLPIWQAKNSAKTLCPGIIVGTGNQKSMKRALLSTQSMQRDLHRAACHLWAQKAHHQCESASSTCLAHVLWMVPRLAWPNHLRDWNEHHQSGMQDVPLKKSLVCCVLLSNWVITCGNSKTLNNSHPKLLRISLTPHSFTAPRWAFPTNASHGKTSQRYTWVECGGTRIKSSRMQVANKWK